VLKTPLIRRRGGRSLLNRSSYAAGSATVSVFDREKSRHEDKGGTEVRARGDRINNIAFHRVRWEGGQGFSQYRPLCGREGWPKLEIIHLIVCQEMESPHWKKAPVCGEGEERPGHPAFAKAAIEGVW